MNNWTDDVVGYLSKGPPNKLKLENITEISLLVTITAAAYWYVAYLSDSAYRTYNQCGVRSITEEEMYQISFKLDG